MPERFRDPEHRPVWKRMLSLCSPGCVECKRVRFEILNNWGHVYRKVYVRSGCGYENDYKLVERKFKGTSYAMRIRT